MPKGVIDIDKKINDYENTLKALKKKKRDMKNKAIIKQTAIIIKAMNKNKDFAADLQTLCDKYSIDLAPKPKQKK